MDRVEQRLDLVSQAMTKMNRPLATANDNLSERVRRSICQLHMYGLLYNQALVLRALSPGQQWTEPSEQEHIRILPQKRD